MSLTVQLRGIDEVLEWFERRAKQPYYCVWDKTQPVSMYNGDDLEEAKEILKDDLERFKKRNYFNPLILSLYPDKSKAYKTTDLKYCSVSFVVEEQLILPSINQNSDGVSLLLLQELKTIKSEVEALKVAKLQEEEEEGDEEEEENNLISGVNQLLDHPIISGLISKWVNGSTPVRNLAGVNEEENLNDYLQTLFSKGVTVAHIKKLSEMPEAKLKMLIQML